MNMFIDYVSKSLSDTSKDKVLLLCKLYLDTVPNDTESKEVFVEKYMALSELEKHFLFGIVVEESSDESLKFLTTSVKPHTGMLRQYQVFEYNDYVGYQTVIDNYIALVLETEYLNVWYQFKSDLLSDKAAKEQAERERVAAVRRMRIIEFNTLDTLTSENVEDGLEYLRTIKDTDIHAVRNVVSRKRPYFGFEKYNKYMFYLNARINRL
jgi:hypothetical protein